jgi:hypothetical protein
MGLFDFAKKLGKKDDPAEKITQHIQDSNPGIVT